MRRREMGERARADLAAIDAALAGETVTGERAPLADLALLLRATRPQPSPEFAHAIDARAASGFAREPRGSRRRRWPAAPTAGLARRPQIAAAVAAVVTVAIVVLAVTTPRGGTGGVHPSVTRPAVTGAGEARPGTVFGAPGQPASPPSPGPAQAGPAQPAGEREVQRSATLDVGVEPGSIQPAARRVFAIVSANGGYVASSSVSSGAGGGASFDVRVPSANLPAAIAALSQLGHVRSESENTNDVTARYGSLASALRDARAERVHVIAQIAASAPGAQREALERRARALDARIASLRHSLEGLQASVETTPLALTLEPEHGAGAGGGGGDLTPGGAAHDAAQVLGAALAVLLIAAAAALPVALLGLAAWAAVTLTRRRLREQALGDR